MANKVIAYLNEEDVQTYNLTKNTNHGIPVKVTPEKLAEWTRISREHRKMQTEMNRLALKGSEFKNY